MLDIEYLKRKFQEIRNSISKEELAEWLNKAELRETWAPYEANLSTVHGHISHWIQRYRRRICGHFVVGRNYYFSLEDYLNNEA